jgi:CDP-glycerol glycerophosphotransferase (TagB/SpsB family)
VNRRYRKQYRISVLLAPLVACLSFFFKRDKDRWAFHINESHGLEGNLRALFDYAYHHPEIEPFIIDARYEDLSWIEEAYPGTPVISHISLMLSSLCLRLSCGVVVITHESTLLNGAFSLVPGISIVNVWHGIPLKGMGNLDEDADPESRRTLLKKRHSNTLFCASSETEKAQIAGCFFFDGDTIKVTGIPRNDWLLCSESELPRDLRDIAAELDSKLTGRSLILYAPTWRDYGHNVTGFDESELATICELLSDRNAVLGIRSHPKERDLFRTLIDVSDNILDLSYTQCPETSVLLRKTDILVTDYSSLWVDFLLLKRPVLGYLFDYEKYKAMRGLMYNYEAIFPGDLVYDFESLRLTLGKYLDPVSTPNVPPKIDWVTSLLHGQTEHGFCENIKNEIDRL